MKRDVKSSIMLAAMLVIFADAANATTVSITSPITTPYMYVSSISSWDTTGVDMNGLSVSVTYNNSSGAQFTETSGWGAAGAVGPGGWSLTMANMNQSTWSTQWIFDVEDNISVSSISITGGENVVFDRWLTPIGTNGSEFGVPFSIDAVYLGTTNLNWYDAGTSKDLGVISVNYSTPVSLNNADPVGDLFQVMTINFQQGYFFTQGKSLAFWADTDNISNPVPEPTTLVLLGMGLAGILGGRSYTRKKIY